MKSIQPRLLKHSFLLAICASVVVAGSPSSAAQLALVNEPLFLNSSAAPLNLLVLGRDHKLYYEAYNDHSDLNNDGVLDVGYKGYLAAGSGGFDYYGYFDSHKCYTYGTAVFNPVRVTTTKACGGANEWSGDWLNYVTTSRIDALRKVLYGGTRSTDTATSTILERSHIPQDAHSWGKEYTSVAVDGYDIRNYTPYTAPVAGRHFFANATLMLDTTAAANWSRPPLLRVALDQPLTRHIWNWVSVESPDAGICVGDGRCTAGDGTAAGPKPDDGKAATTDDGDTGPGKTITIQDKTVRVEVCKNANDSTGASLLETNCEKYPDGNYKPTGLLQGYGENDSMLFGLLTGSYQKSKSGGVMRKDVGTITDEINANDGTLKATVGIIRTIDKLRATGYTNYKNNTWYRQAGRGAGTVYSPGLVTTRPFNEGEFGGMWGNPIAEMMYEGLRYFAGKTSPTTDFQIPTTGTFDSALGLPQLATWTNPYAGTRPSCAKPFEMVMSDVNVSYDTDQLPGSSFGGITGDLTPAFNAATLAQTIWDNEMGGSKSIFIGQSGATYDGAPTPKTATSFGSIRGLAPEEPTKQGGYYAASAAYYGLTTDVNTKAGDQKVQTFAVALASPLPRVEIPVGTGKITLVPFGKSVGGASINAAKGEFQPTNQIVDFYLETLTPTSGTFQVNFEDVEAGNDHDMDAIVRYTYNVVGNSVTVTASSDYAAGGIIQHMGYVVSGSSADGIYLVVRDQDTAAGTDVSYFLDTPPGVASGGCATTLCAKQADGSALPLASTKTFTAGSTTGATILNDPLWYAAKWGGFRDDNKNGKPDVKSEWDADGDGNPDNYFLVTNALTLGTQLSNAFNEIIKRTASASSATVNSGSVSSTSRVFQATFDSKEWTGHLLSYKVDPKTGALSKSPIWDAAASLPDDGSRSIFTMGSDGTPIDFDWTNVSKDTTLKAELGATDTAAQDMLNYLRGSEDKEATKSGGTFRSRPVKLGDIINSSPSLVGKPSFFYSDKFEAEPYSTFRTDHASRDDVIYVGANDGMLHAFDVTDSGKGKELFAYIPRTVFPNLKQLASTSYKHKYFVDGSPNMGDVFTDGEWRSVVIGGMNNGGQGIYALDVTDPTTFSASKVLWEFTDRNAGAKGDTDLGFTYSQPAIVRLKTGQWAAVFGNGYNSSAADGYVGSGKAMLFLVDIATGDLIQKIDTQVGTAADPNGLATPAIVDIDGDSIADFVYAGDLRGNMWKFDIRSATSSDWKVSYQDASSNPAPLYVAKDASSNTQPITSRPEVARGPNGVGAVVLFGTGKYLEFVDKTVDTAAPRVQSFYGILDRNTGANTDAFSGRGLLTGQDILAEISVPTSEKDAAGVTKNANVRVSSSNNAVTGARGWYMDLLTPPTPPATAKIYKGERVVSNPIFRDGRVIFTTLIPQSDPCSFGGDSWIMELSALTGGRLDVSPIDVNRDGVIDDKDYQVVKIGGVDVRVPVSGTQSEVGIVPEPGILSDRLQPVEYKYTAGSSGDIQSTRESTNPKAQGRQSWRPVR